MLPEDWLRATSRSIEAVRMVDASVPSMARLWNYLVGGRDNFEADRTATKRLRAAAPLLPQLARAGLVNASQLASCQVLWGHGGARLHKVT